MVQAWHVLEPATKFIDNWHLYAMCEHLEACYRGEIKNLIINVPPRHQKSLLVSVFFPMWVWTMKPSTRWIYASYSQDLSTRDSLKCRNLIRSPWYRELYGHVFHLTSDQNVKTKFENNKTGFRQATGVGGFGTGEGAEFLVADDPHKVQEAESDVELENVYIWWTETMSSRFNDPENFCQIIVMQRVHEKDLSGRMLARDYGYEHLCIPFRYEDTEQARSRVTCLGWKDPRTVDGELIDKVRFSEETAAKFEKKLGAYGAAGQLQQRPAPRSAGIFRRSDFQVRRVLPHNIVRIVRYWDKAFTEGGGAYTVGVLMGITANDDYWMLDVVRGQWESKGRDDVILATARWDNENFGFVETYFEQEPGDTGKSSVRILRKKLKGFHSEGDRPTKDKVLRARPLSSQVQGHNVYLLESIPEAREEQEKYFRDRADWNEDFLAEYEKFPRGTYKDQVDAGSGAFTKLTLDDRAQVTEPEIVGEFDIHEVFEDDREYEDESIESDEDEENLEDDIEYEDEDDDDY